MNYGTQYDGYGQNYGGYAGYPSPVAQPQIPVQQPQQAVLRNVNKIYVTSLEDALARFANTNTITVYHLQDESGEIEIATDGFGKKSYKMRKLIDYSLSKDKKEPQSNYVTAEQFYALESRLLALEGKADKSAKTKKEEAVDNE